VDCDRCDTVLGPFSAVRAIYLCAYQEDGSVAWLASVCHRDGVSTKCYGMVRHGPAILPAET